MTSPSEIGRKAPRLRFEGPGDAPVSLATLHADAPLVLVFLRHFG